MTSENTDPQHGAEASTPSLLHVDEARALRPLGPGLRRRVDGTVTLSGYGSDEEFDMSSGSHSARRGYLEDNRDGGDSNNEQDLLGFHIVNRCLGCGEDLGDANPRQYCCKTHCPHDSDVAFEEEGGEPAMSAAFEVRTRVVARRGVVTVDLSTVECAALKALRF